jgi:hypothetical protein
MEYRWSNLPVSRENEPFFYVKRLYLYGFGMLSPKFQILWYYDAKKGIFAAIANFSQKIVANMKINAYLCIRLIKYRAKKSDFDKIGECVNSTLRSVIIITKMIRGNLNKSNIVNGVKRMADLFGHSENLITLSLSLSHI